MLRQPARVFAPKLKQTVFRATSLAETARFVNGRLSKTKPTAIVEERSLAIEPGR
jgi:hypothetical protein